MQGPYSKSMRSHRRRLFTLACLTGLTLPAASWGQAVTPDDVLALRWSWQLAAPAAAKGATTSSAPSPLPLQTSSRLAPVPVANADGWPQLLARAAEHAASSRAADAAAQAADAVSRQAWATAWMPRVDASASGSRQKQTYNGLQSRTPASSATLTATLPVWRAADRAQARSQDALAEQARWQARSTRQAVAQDLSTAWLSALEAAELQRLTAAQLALLQEQQRINERRLQAGAGTVLDVLETRTRVDQARASLEELGGRIASQRLVIERLSGGPVRLPAGLQAGIDDVPDAVPDPMEAMRLVSERNPQLLEARLQLEATQRIEQARQAESWQPTVDAYAEASRTRQLQQFEGISERQNITSQAVGIQLNWPLFTGGYHQGRTQEAAALLAQARARLDDTRSQVDANLRDAYLALQQARQLVAVQRQVERTAADTYDAVRKAFTAGMRTNQDLLDAQQQIYTARQSLVQARVRALTAQVSILGLLEQLDATGVEPLTVVIDPAPHQDRRP